MNKTLKVEIELQIDKDKMPKLLDKIRAKLANIDEIENVINLTVWEFNKDRGIWLTYGWGFDEGRTQIWNPLNQEKEGKEKKMANRNGLVNSAPGEYKSTGIRYVVANTVEAVRELIIRRERGEITYEFIARKRNGDRVFAVEGLVN